MDFEPLYGENKVINWPGFLLQVTTASAPRNGRPPIDLAVATRNRLLALQVKYLAGCNWDELDAQLLDLPAHDTLRRRLMWSMARYGTRPETPKKQEASLKLIERIAENKVYDEAMVNFQSKLWTLLIPPGLGLAAKRSLLQELVSERGLFRASDTERIIGNWIFPKAPTYRSRLQNSMQLLAMEMNGTHLLDKIALFCCAYADSMDRLDLTEAQDCIFAMRGLLSFYDTDIGEKAPDLFFDLVDLITVRLLKNDWSNTLDFARDRKIRALSRVGRLSYDNPRASKEDGTLLPFSAVKRATPIIFLDEQSRWLQKHSVRLQKAFERAGSPTYFEGDADSPIDVSERESAADLERKIGIPIPK